MRAQPQMGLGGVQLARPPALAWISGGGLCAPIAVFILLLCGQYTRKATASGVLAPYCGLIRLVPAGAVLFVLGLDRPLLAGEAQAQVHRSLAEAAKAQAALVSAQQATLQRRLAALDLELAQVDVEAGLLRQRLAMAEQ